MGPGSGTLGVGCVLGEGDGTMVGATVGDAVIVGCGLDGITMVGVGCGFTLRSGRHNTMHKIPPAIIGGMIHHKAGPGPRNAAGAIGSTQFSSQTIPGP